MKPKCTNGCRYSKQMNQPYPRMCVDCGWSEQESMLEQAVNRSIIRQTKLQDLAQLMALLEQRNSYISKIGQPGTDEFCFGMIEEVNKMIKKVLNL